MATKKNEPVLLTVVRDLVVPMPEPELREVADELAELIGERERIEADKKDEVRRFNEQLEGLVAKINVAAQQLREGGSTEKIECRLELNVDTNTAKLIRTDTNPWKVVETRAMTADEREKALQPELPVSQDETAAALGDGEKKPKTKAKRAKKSQKNGRAVSA